MTKAELQHENEVLRTKYEVYKELYHSNLKLIESLNKDLTDAFERNSILIKEKNELLQIGKELQKQRNELRNELLGCYYNVIGNCEITGEA